MRSLIVYVSLILIILLSSSGLNRYKNPQENLPLKLGTNRELFIDNYLVEKFKGACIIMHHPQDEGIVMYFDKPWEGIFSTYATIIKDDGLFRLYYRGLNSTSGPQYTCYAESKDGINWIKPSLDLYEIDGTRQNNVLLNYEPVTHNFCPFLDTNKDAGKDQKFKAMGGDSRTGLIPFVSPDGINWKKIRNDGVIKKGAFDSQNVSFWSESEKLYVCYFRIFSDKKVRGVSRSVSKDFINWSEPEEMTYGNTPPEHLYTQQTSPYFRATQIYIAIGARFVPDRQVLTVEQLKKLGVDPTQYKGLSEPYFMSTRGGNLYDRTFMEAFIRPGIGQNNWSARTNYPVLNVVQTSPQEMSVFVNQDYAQPTAHLHRYSMRLDGFASVNAPYSGGEVLTRPFMFSGEELEINYSTSVTGEIRIEIQDKNGVPFPGFTLEESQPVTGNEIASTVRWKAKGKVKELESCTVRLHIVMKDADLYSIRFK